MLFTTLHAIWRHYGSQAPNVQLPAKRLLGYSERYPRKTTVKVRPAKKDRAPTARNRTPQPRSARTHPTSAAANTRRQNYRPRDHGDLQPHFDHLVSKLGDDCEVDYYLSFIRLRLRTPKAKGLHHHHIVPRCLGGSDSPENLVWLSPVEHIKAHQRLAGAFPWHDGLVRAPLLLQNDWDRTTDVVDPAPEKPKGRTNLDLVPHVLAEHLWPLLAKKGKKGVYRPS